MTETNEVAEYIPMTPAEREEFRKELVSAGIVELADKIADIVCEDE